MGEIGDQPDDLVEVSYRAVVIPLVLPAYPAVIGRRGFLRVEPAGLGEVGDRLDIPLLGLPAGPTAVKRDRQLRVQLDRPAEVGDREIEIPLALQGIASIVIGPGVRLELD